MIYCQGHTVSFQEVPDEVSLTLLIGGCPHHCKGCHSPELQTEKGFALTQWLIQLLDEYEKAITCVCFMGTGRDERALQLCLRCVKGMGLKTCVYTGDSFEKASGSDWFSHAWVDYLKTGEYVEARGPLNEVTTNQHMWKIEGENLFEDITWKFQQKKK